MTINLYLHNNLSSLAACYNMSCQSFKEAIAPLKIDNNTKVFTHAEINRIITHLGDPNLIDGTIDPTKVCTNKALSKHYNVSRQTISNWLIPIADKLKLDDECRRRYYPFEVRLILDFLG